MPPTTKIEPAVKIIESSTKEKALLSLDDIKKFNNFTNLKINFLIKYCNQYYCYRQNMQPKYLHNQNLIY